MNEYHSSLHLPIRFILFLAGLFLVLRLLCWFQNISLHALAPLVDGYILFVVGLLLAHYIDDYFGFIPRISKK
ncbi:hypothetical protein [Telluribacter sp.]|jgi:hypothetical protein|uniref:hypothetical protein n=1 Tax=Telluribacter sp. TaxID=1978767 RepID=UPI002E104BB4|nr:hypothetical protein [Telluribacter sp.]